MLAYVFWHFPRPEIEVPAYERSLLDFHAALSEAGAEGFVGSASFRVQGAPWINQGADAYADWYLLEGSFALDPLNEVAVSGPRRPGHDQAAAAAASGAGGLYRLMEGDADAQGAAAELWLTKPRSTSYDDFYGWARPLARAAGGGLWRRQMVLGPAPEFCLLAASGVGLPAGVEAIEVGRAPLAV